MKLEVIRNGRRYWAHRIGLRVNFWSDHSWPFYHGHIDSHIDSAVTAAFYKWVPLEY